MPRTRRWWGCMPLSRQETCSELEDVPERSWKILKGFFGLAINWDIWKIRFAIGLVREHVME
jgi:hypothetical protein